MEGSVTPDVKIGVLTVPSGLSLDKFSNSLPNNRDLNLEVVQRIARKDRVKLSNGLTQFDG